MNVSIKNVSKYPVLIKDSVGRKVVVLASKENKNLILEENSTFHAIVGASMIDMGRVTLLRLNYDVSGMSAIGPLPNAVLQPQQRGRLIIGKPTEYRDDLIFSQKSSLKSYTGGVPWVDIVNYTNTTLTFQDGLGEPAPTFSIAPGDVYRYKGRYHWGVNYGTYIKNIGGLFDTIQILSPITHLLYGVL